MSVHPLKPTSFHPRSSATMWIILGAPAGQADWPDDEPHDTPNTKEITQTNARRRMLFLSHRSIRWLPVQDPMAANLSDMDEAFDISKQVGVTSLPSPRPLCRG